MQERQTDSIENQQNDYCKLDTIDGGASQPCAPIEGASMGAGNNGGQRLYAEGLGSLQLVLIQGFHELALIQPPHHAKSSWVPDPVGLEWSSGGRKKLGPRPPIRTVAQNKAFGAKAIRDHLGLQMGPTT